MPKPKAASPIASGMRNVLQAMLMMAGGTVRPVP